MRSLHIAIIFVNFAKPIINTKNNPMLLYGMSWFALVSIRQWLWYGTLVVKVIMICCWYGNGGFVGIGIDWNHGFVRIKSVLLAVVVYLAMAMDITPWYL